VWRWTTEEDMDRKTTLRKYTSTWQGQTASLPRTLAWTRLTEVPLPFWALVLIAAGLAGAAAVSGVPRAGNPEAADLQTRVSLLAAQVRDLRSNVELKVLEIERLQLIQDYSTEFSIPAHRARQIYDIALAEGVNPQLAFNLVRVESGFRRTAVSSAGAIGYTQIRPSTARWLDPTVTAKDLFNTGINLHLGFRYFRYLLDEYNGDTRLALLAYNRGPTRVGDLLTSGIDPANGYAQRVLGE
jgi:soluble lytic murein transglycosylase-like protein